MPESFYNRIQTITNAHLFQNLTHLLPMLHTYEFKLKTNRLIYTFDCHNLFNHCTQKAVSEMAAL